ncbi:MAG: hypothetical protein H6720_13685 [Sandaracinus sp.]|nr:hypothetical protein [Sandaracinus sp.]
MQHPNIRKLLLLLAIATGCGGGSSAGDVTFVVQAEDSITEGLSPEGGDEAIADGWSVTFDRYAIAMGEIELGFATDATRQASAEELFVVDLASLPPSGLSLWQLEGLRTGRWEVSYVIGHAAEATRHESVPADAYQRMVDETCTYLIEGRLAKTDGRSCPPASLATPPEGVTADEEGCYPAAEVAFSFCVDAETIFGPCQAEDGPSGVAITEGGSSATLTIHGDHLFFNGFPEGEEGAVMRLAQWLADCDLNLDGTVTRAELEAIAPSDLAELDARYDLSSPFDDLVLDDMWTYVRAQLKTQGHFQGEGECPFDGLAHDHE